MWNGWEMATAPFSICHSSTVFSVTVLAFAGFSSNFLSSIVCWPPCPGLVELNRTRRGLFAVPHGDDELGSSAMQPDGAVRGAFASAVVMLVRKDGGCGMAGMNCARGPVAGGRSLLTLIISRMTGIALGRSDGSTSCCTMTG